MWRAILSRLNFQRSRKAVHVPDSLTRRMATLGQRASGHGRGSDLAAAELKGITHTILELCR